MKEVFYSDYFFNSGCFSGRRNCSGAEQVIIQSGFFSEYYWGTSRC